MTNEQIVIRIQAGIDTADNMLLLWQQNKGFIAKIAMRYEAYEPIDDLTQEGYFGLHRAVECYRMEEGVPFIKYAGYWIRQAIVRYCENNGKVRIPVHQRTQMGRYKKFINSFSLQMGREPTDKEAMNYMELSQESLLQLKKDLQVANMGSLDVPIGEDGENTLYELVPSFSDEYGEVLERMQQDQLQETIWSMVDELPGVLPTVIRRRYQHGCTLKEVAKFLGCGYQYVATLQNKALRELRKPSKADRLRPFLYDDKTYSRALRGGGVGRFNATWTSSTEYVALRELG